MKIELISEKENGKEWFLVKKDGIIIQGGVLSSYSEAFEVYQKLKYKQEKKIIVLHSEEI